MPTQTENLRIAQSQPLITPAVLADELPCNDELAARVASYRRDIENILCGRDPRILVIVGPCSVHDPAALLDYAAQLKTALADHHEVLYPVLRVYFEKPRTVVGWKGLINDPDMDESFHINKGLHLARQVLIDVAELGLPAATEFLDTTFGQFFADLVSFGAIGARTVESQVHRELASGLSMPVGFKNGTNGSVGVAIDAIRSSRQPHWFPSLTREGAPAVLRSTGNEYAFLILRGGESGPNYHAESIESAQHSLVEYGLEDTVIVDCSHANSGKKPRRQMDICVELAAQIANGNRGIRGMMIESHLVEGRQEPAADLELVYGQSVTDACLGIEDTIEVLGDFARRISGS